MALGPSNPTWAKLHESLASLANDCGGACAFVLDEGNGLWCVGVPGVPNYAATYDEDRYANRFYADVVLPRENDLRKGKRIEAVKTEGTDRYAAISFAAIYMLVVWFDGPFEPFAVRAKMRHALPIIEALVLRLPPSGGPGADEAAGKMRA